MKKSLALAVAPPAVVGVATDMNRHDYLHELSTRNGRRRFGKREDEVDAAKLAKAFADAQKAWQTRDAELAAAVKKANEEVAAQGKASAETMGKVNEMLAKAGEMGQQLLELQQKFIAFNDNLPNRGQQRAKSVGFQLIENPKFKEWTKPENRGGKFRMSLKAITSATTGSGDAGDLIQTMRVPEIIRPQDRLLTIRDLLSQGRTGSNAVEYVQETGFTNNAAPVAETAQKPESSLEFQLKTVPVRVLAHWMQASKQVLDDAPLLQSYIDNRLRFGLKLVEENQILAGDGTGQNLLGLIPQAAAYNRPGHVGDTRIDVIRRAMTQVRIAEFRADGVVLNPVDWEEIELTKTTEGAYVWANPRLLLSPTIWGLNVVDTTAMPEEDFLVGAFQMSAVIWDREEANVEVSTEDRDNFIKNMVTIRGEERLALGVWRPEALVNGDFSEVVSGA